MPAVLKPISTILNTYGENKKQNRGENFERKRSAVGSVFMCGYLMEIKLQKHIDN